ncbi:NRDE-2, necessary for RNA interference-domain-containing protein [Triangularia setosa]|uniref:NRDE-2, necessary for RNA interference-domain-containing protein n=1 Tax=Triangularia setosa TaxID=2587417 RepID=A0AAN6WEG4_9PEZI|nr:NRDE-2, necessary for RNA interference-domain-containing protein [Podospora setosa]
MAEPPQVIEFLSAVGGGISGLHVHTAVSHLASLGRGGAAQMIDLPSAFFPALDSSIIRSWGEFLLVNVNIHPKSRENKAQGQEPEPSVKWECRTMPSKEEKRQRAVPKFGSFQPKPTPEPEAGPASGEARKPVQDRHGDPGGEFKRRHDDCERDRGRREKHRDSGRERERHGAFLDRDDERRRRRHEKDGERRRSRSRDRNRERERDRQRDRGRDWGREKRRDGERHDNSREDSAQPRSSVKPAPAALTINDNFFIDKKGDPLLFRYGGNDRSKIPAYYRSGNGKILGSRGHLILHRDGPRDLFSLSFSREGLGSAFRDKVLLSRIQRTKSRRIRASTKPPPPPTEEFIPLAPSKKRKRGQDSPGPDSGEDQQPDYRSIYGKAKPPASDSESDGSENDGEGSAEGTKELSSAKTESIRLTRHLRSSPADVSAWLELMSLQESLFAEDIGHPRPRTDNETKALAELKLSLYQEALGHLPSSSLSAQRDTLILGMMTTGLKIWDDKTAAKKWESLPQKYDATPDSSFELWRARLNWEMSRVGSCTVEKIRDMLTAKLKALSKELSGPEEGSSMETCRQIVYVFVRLTRLLQDAGYVERAVASWQVLLEMTFSRPSTASSPGSFEEFWESEVARFGEAGAKGWADFEAGGGDDMPPDPKFDPGDTLDRQHCKDPYQLWVATERKRAEKSRMPARTLDEGIDEDPFRVVMWGDIKDFVVWFPAELLDVAKQLVLGGFAVFVGVPSTCGEEVAKKRRHDPFLAATGQAFRPWEINKREEMESVDVDLSKPPPEFGQQGGDMAVSPELLFTKEGWFKCLDSWDKTHLPGGPLDLQWVLGTLKRLVMDYQREELAEVYLAMEWLNGDPKSTKKVAKGLLKQYSTSMGLYNAYALIEWANNNPGLAFKVLDSATNLPGSQLLWNTRVWLHLQSSQNDLALTALCRSVDPDANPSLPPSPALLLKAKSHFSTVRDFSLSSGQLETVISHAESLLLLEYLSSTSPNPEPTSPNQGNITAALSTIPSLTSEFQSRSLQHSHHLARLLQTASRLLYFHATAGPHRPTFLLTHLTTYLKLFPSNTIFLSLLAWAQPPLLINDPVRSFLQDVALPPKHDCLSTRRWAIMYEVNNGTAHSTKAAFETALTESEDVCKGSAELWRGYVKFCAAVANKEVRRGGKGVFYRGIANCSWDKELYLTAFDEGVMGMNSGEELRAVVGTLVGKGVRVGVDLEEFLIKLRDGG